jgi:type I restriction enzyme S subunit
MSSVVTADVNDDYYLNSFCFGLRLKDIEKFNLNFLKHLFRSWIIRKQIFNTASGVTRFNVSKKRFAEIEIPVPPMPVQEEIVRILDKFEKLTTDISEGLPAEIAARQKQYEYYRDRLLNFKRLEA